MHPRAGESSSEAGQVRRRGVAVSPSNARQVSGGQAARENIACSCPLGLGEGRERRRKRGTKQRALGVEIPEPSGHEL